MLVKKAGKILRPAHNPREFFAPPLAGMILKGSATFGHGTTSTRPLRD